MSDFHFSPRPNRAHEIAWRNWGDAAFAEAKGADKPILLAISAVWCHWCHVMDETSYSDDEVIRTVNERYVPVRVDNDQRPDVNRRYNMGGWPSTVFLTPDGEILNGATYVPPEAMRRQATQIADIWRDQRAELAPRLSELRRHEADAHAQRPADIGPEIVTAIRTLVRGQYDAAYGGFGREPKFPQPKLLRFVLDDYRRVPTDEGAAMLHRTLGAMAGGGLYDPVEGGFFRYATTRAWQVPHFEKMLEDNAELLALYAEAHRTFPSAGYDRVVRDVIRWMDAVLLQPEASLFAGSQDADERYYELDAAERARHGAPYVDRTIYTSWNALAASAYIAAAQALGDDALAERGRAVMRALAKRMWDGRTLAHFERGEGPTLRGLLTDLAACLAAMLDEYEAGLAPGALAAASAMAGTLRETLEDPERGGFFDAPAGEAPGRLGMRDKPIEDNASVAETLLRLALLTADDAWRDVAARTLQAFAAEYRQWGQFAAAYAAAVARALAEPRLAVVVGGAADPLARALWRTVLASDDPAGGRQWLVPGRDDALLRARGYPADRAAAFVCVGSTCSAPLASPPDLAAELARARTRFMGD